MRVPGIVAIVVDSPSLVCPCFRRASVSCSCLCSVALENEFLVAVGSHCRSCGVDTGRDCNAGRDLHGVVVHCIRFAVLHSLSFHRERTRKISLRSDPTVHYNVCVMR